ncbi:hypothetical protein [Helicobacter turcicus]|uniref:Dihydroneopterin aldolase n=1 Tax=Helicobacter turcicus TaxID=2867412 RepID=A0ABS7JLX3_9HELI|nr:hypothetical protein [Helicobacter turcicus]MBX7490394.1 hypothetical protein [Helicobacter turcicus]MBX7545252.1 hypothetical protein [Helicobacter turcicus]
MKVALICDSLLLDRSLEMYLKEYLTSYKMCDFVVATQHVESQKPVFLIGDMEGAQLKIPFTKELLLKELESFYHLLKGGKNESLSAEREIEDIKALNHTSASIAESLDSIVLERENLDSTFSSDLSAKIEEILKRYAKEIEITILEHFKENRG